MEGKGEEGEGWEREEGVTHACPSERELLMFWEEVEEKSESDRRSLERVPEQWRGMVIGWDGATSFLGWAPIGVEGTDPKGEGSRGEGRE